MSTPFNKEVAKRQIAAGGGTVLRDLEKAQVTIKTMMIFSQSKMSLPRVFLYPALPFIFVCIFTIPEKFDIGQSLCQLIFISCSRKKQTLKKRYVFVPNASCTKDVSKQEVQLSAI